MLLKQLLMTVVMLAFTSVAMGQTGTSDRIQNDLNAIRTLEKSLTVDFFETRMGDAMAELKTTTGLTFRLDESAEDNNLDVESLITASYKDTRLATVMQFILEEYQCTWSVQDGVIVILSDDAALDQLNLTVLNCSDILAGIKPRKETQTVWPRRSRSGGFGGGGRAGGGGGGVFSMLPQETPTQAESGSESEAKPSDNANPAEQVQVHVRVISPHDQLLNLVIEAVDPNSWEENGGNARIKSLNDLLIIRQTAENIREINLLLDHLRTSGL